MNILDFKNVNGKLVHRNEIIDKQERDIKLLKIKIAELKKIKDSVNDNKAGKSQDIRFRVLLFQYLIGNSNDYDKTNLAKILSLIMNTGEENIRGYLSNPKRKITNERYRSLLEKVIKTFEKHNLKEPLKSVERDLKRISAK